MTALAEHDPLTADWIFKDNPPSTEEVRRLLTDLPPWFGVNPLQLFPFVQPLPQSKARVDPVTGQNVMVPDPNNSKIKVKAMDKTFSLYMSVAGRQVAMQRAAELNQWRVEFTPEPVTPTGIPGVLRMDGAIVYREYCLAPETPVLGSDLRWKPISEYREGETVIGFDEQCSAKTEYRLATVEATKRLVKKCVTLDTDLGKVTCSEDHYWLIKRGPTRPREWCAAASIEPGWKIVGYAPVWQEDRSFDAGWMAGILDGEGSIRAGGIEFGQNPGPVLDRALEWLTVNGYRYSAKLSSRDCIKVNILGGRSAMARLLGTIRPTRLMLKSSVCWLGRTWGKSPSIYSTVHSVVEAGEREVIAMQTDTKTFIAQGMMSHNCEIWHYNEDGTEQFLGRKPGMAWVPGVEDRKQAAKSNPFEKVETAARGRSIGAWGIGILPGSGVASLEEMQAAQQYQADDERRERRGAPAGAVPGSDDEMPSHEELVSNISTAYEEMRQLRGITEEEKVSAMLSYMQRAFGVDASDGAGGVDFTKLSPGKLVLMRNVAAQGVANLKAEAAGL